MNRYISSHAILIILALCVSPVSLAANGKGKPGKVDVIMVYDAKPDQAEKNRVKALGGETKREFKNFNMRVISVSENALKNLGNGKGVKFVAADRETFGMSDSEWSGSGTSQSAAHRTARVPSSGTNNAPIKGYGVGVAIIDSGVGTHVDLSSTIRQYDFLNGGYPQPSVSNTNNNLTIYSYNSNSRSDPLGHGTHVAGIGN